MNQKALGKSKEDYLKAILIMQIEYGACRVIDVAKHMDVSKSSASIALKKLEQEGLVTKSDWRVLFTEKGKAIAEELYEKDHFFAEWFKKIGVSEKTAEADACLIEHVVSEETFRKIKDYLLSVDKECVVHS